MLGYSAVLTRVNRTRRVFWDPSVERAAVACMLTMADVTELRMDEARRLAVVLEELADGAEANAEALPEEEHRAFLAYVAWCLRRLPHCREQLRALPRKHAWIRLNKELEARSEKPDGILGWRRVDAAIHEVLLLESEDGWMQLVLHLVDHGHFGDRLPEAPSAQDRLALYLRQQEEDLAQALAAMG